MIQTVVLMHVPIRGLDLLPCSLIRTDGDHSDPNHSPELILQQLSTDWNKDKDVVIFMFTLGSDTNDVVKQT